jgi:hypothetical protein
VERLSKEHQFVFFFSGFLYLYWLLLSFSALSSLLHLVLLCILQFIQLFVSFLSSCSCFLYSCCINLAVYHILLNFIELFMHISFISFIILIIHLNLEIEMSSSKLRLKLRFRIP